MKQAIIDILSNNDLNGFTTLWSGDKLHRYIVTYTNNTIFSLDLLCSQIENTPYKDNITIGGRQDQETKKVYVDIGTSTDSLSKAIDIGKLYNQIAIRDNELFQEIRL